ncbi:MAG: sodium-dependent transporter [Pirellulales bacterium]|nr:sodium-dependent transporter [Pirellulales bacterium]
MHTPGKKREAWATQLGVILAVMGSAVGLGNFLRFPGLAAKYEGGAFMIPYFTALLFLGLPLCWAEWALGRYGGNRGHNSGPGIFRAVSSKRFVPYGGVLVLIVPIVIYMYYVFIEAWCLAYAWYMLTGQLALGKNSAEYVKFFDNFVGGSRDGVLFGAGGGPTLSFVALCFLLNFTLIYRGLSKGIEWFCRWAMPALILCAIVVVIRVLTLGTPNPAEPEWNVLNGLGFMWNPHTDKIPFGEALQNPQMWMEAAGQIFFSISVGFGTIITYSSYLRRRDDVALSALTGAAGNEFCEVALGGLMTIPAAFVFLGPVACEHCGSSFDLGFKTLPMIFQYMPLGQIVGTLFFILLFLAAVTSSVAMLQPGVALMEEGLGMRRKTSVLWLGLLTMLGTGFIVFFSKNLVALNTFDFWVGTLAIYLLATAEAILFGWVLGIKQGMAEIDAGAKIRVPRILGFILKYVTPVYLLGVIALWIRQQIMVSKDNQFRAIADDPVVRWSVVFIVAVSLLLGVLTFFSLRRWRKAERARQEATP